MCLTLHKLRRIVWYIDTGVCMSRRVKGLAASLVVGLALVTTACSSGTGKSNSIPPPTASPSPSYSSAPYYPTPDDPIKGTNRDVKGAHLLARYSGTGATKQVFLFRSTGLNKITWGYSCSGPGTITLNSPLGIANGRPGKCDFSTVSSSTWTGPFSANDGFSVRITDPNTQWLVVMYGWK